MAIENSIYIFGCGGQARSVIHTLRQKDKTTEIILIDPNCTDGETIMDCGTVKSIDMVKDEGKGRTYFVGIGNNRDRSEIFERIVLYPGSILTIISPFAVIGEEKHIGIGTFVGANTYIGPEAEIGKNTIINTGSIIEHETIIGNHTHIAPGAVVCGRCRIGDYVMVGAGSTIIDKIRIGNYVTIGAGSTVIRDILEPGTYAGSPARKITSRKNC